MNDMRIVQLGSLVLSGRPTAAQRKLERRPSSCRSDRWRCSRREQLPAASGAGGYPTCCLLSACTSVSAAMLPSVSRALVVLVPALLTCARLRGGVVGCAAVAAAVSREARWRRRHDCAWTSFR